MKNFARSALFTSVIMLSLAAHAEEQNRNLPAFKNIKSKSAMTLVVEVGKTQSVLVKGDAKFIASVSTEVVGDELVITSLEKNSIKISDNTQVLITVPELNRFKMEGAGSSSINNAAGERLDIFYEGAGMLKAKGKVKFLSLKAKGVGLVDTKNLITEQADVSLEGVGAVKVYASERLKASVQGIGSLTYYGKPHSVSKSVEGIGSVNAGD
ncbi:GIN domain-containing protein [Undibacterium sp. Ren11W]|uniref:GIN domain-containing protein n=1 Tax=Undibacterium sp. Ren11W TaxID=3413045 RepID=UPI003BF402F6